VYSLGLAKAVPTPRAQNADGQSSSCSIPENSAFPWFAIEGKLAVAHGHRAVRSISCTTTSCPADQRMPVDRRGIIGSRPPGLVRRQSKLQNIKRDDRNLEFLHLISRFIIQKMSSFFTNILYHHLPGRTKNLLFIQLVQKWPEVIDIPPSWGHYQPIGPACVDFECQSLENMTFLICRWVESLQACPPMPAPSVGMAPGVFDVQGSQMASLIFRKRRKYPNWILIKYDII